MKMDERKINCLPVHIYENREEMGVDAAKDAAARINRIIEEKGEANVVFAAAPSQDDLLENLLKEDIDWTKVRGFHQDEYVGIDKNEPAGFGNFLRRAIFDKVPFKELHYLQCEADEAEEKCETYTKLLKKYPIDLIFLGIGENGHLAFNDPAVADFHDSKMVKIVELDEVCRQQQVNDGCFPSLDAVPKKAMTLTMSFIMNVPEAICVVPTIRKADAVYHALYGEVTTACPSSILRNHPGAALYLDKDSASRI
ncbi:MAG: glucosamine-6-phosphate deaminase [Roseburia sp.]|nr:glucosamine-6-phosphate deaminase [Roseburia sp.]